MHGLNFHHLLLFTTLVREGSLVAAGRVLRLSHSALSAQVHAFEKSVGAKLLERQGRRLVPTDEGRAVFRYGEEIFGLGRELLECVQGRAVPTSRLRIGIVNTVPKLILSRLQSLLSKDPLIHLVCIGGTHERVLAKLGLREIDVVLSDAPAKAGSPLRAYSHPLGTCNTSMFGTATFERLREGFPRSLDGAPMLLPFEVSPLRRALNLWFAANEIRPRVVAEFEDSSLLHLMAQSGAGIFAAPSALEREIERDYGVKVLGRVPEVSEQFYAISRERRIRDPVVAAIFSAAQSQFLPADRRGEPNQRRRRDV